MKAIPVDYADKNFVEEWLERLMLEDEREQGSGLSWVRAMGFEAWLSRDVGRPSKGILFKKKISTIVIFNILKGQSNELFDL